jgi:hypothetical protein
MVNRLTIASQSIGLESIENLPKVLFGGEGAPVPASGHPRAEPVHLLEDGELTPAKMAISTMFVSTRGGSKLSVSKDMSVPPAADLFAEPC